MPRGRPGKAVVSPVLVFLALCAVSCSPEPTAVDPADLVFRGGAVYTMDADRPWASAVAVEAGRIVYVGDEVGVAAWIGEQTEVIELGAGMLLPGFHDSHMHPMAAGTTYLRCPLDGLSWPNEVLARLSGCASALEEGAWLRATGIDASVLKGYGPGMAALDEVSAGHPALVTAGKGEIGWVNSEALRRLGIDEASTLDGIALDPATGEPTGVLSGDPLSQAWALASNYSQDSLREGLRLASRLANSLGITSANEASASIQHSAAYRAAEAAGEMTLRVHASLRWDPSSDISQLEGFKEQRRQATGPRFRADSVKFFLDGGIGGHTAHLLEPYAGSEDLGSSHYGNNLAGLAEAVDAAGFNLHFHAYGDRAVRNALDAVEQAVATNPPRDRRHQLAHVALIHPDDLPRFSELGVTADIQPLWAWKDAVMGKECDALGSQRCKRLLAFRDLFDSGTRVVAGSDWISDSMSPLYGIQVALTRRPPDGGGPPWNADQRVTLEEMLRAYTLEGAWIAGTEALTGSIEVGKAADLVMLERNLFAVDPMAINDVKVLRTLLEGKIVYANSGSGSD